MKKKIVAFRLSPKIVQELEDIAKRKKTTKTAILERILDDQIPLFEVVERLETENERLKVENEKLKRENESLLKENRELLKEKEELLEKLLKAQRPWWRRILG